MFGSGRQDALLAFQFSVTVTGTGIMAAQGYFREISGLTTELEVVEYKTVDARGVSDIQRIPGREKPGTVTMKRGITTDMGFWLWYEAVKMTGANVNRSLVTIELKNRDYSMATVFNLMWAWPSKISGPQVRSDSNEVAIEELTLVYESMHRLPTSF